MKVLNVTQARKEIYHLLKQVSLDHQPIQITGKESTAVLVAEEDWRAINETLYLCSIKGMKESIIKGMNTDLKECADSLEW